MSDVTEHAGGGVPHLGYCPHCEYLSDRRAAAPETDPVRPRVRGAVVATVVLLTAIAPLATDMDVPAFPRVARDLRAGGHALTASGT